tara:strand:+ start:73 stop:672 length:600 start_codon:yes stop_codon:yes gene_type:complete
MSRARDMANLGAQAGSGLDASDITTGTLGAVTLGTSVVFPTGAVVGYVKNQTTPSIQSATQSYVDITGSSITYTPTTGASFVVYECSFVTATSYAEALPAFRFFLDGVVTKHGDSYAPFYHGTSDQLSTNRQIHRMIYSASGWTSDKVVKMKFRGYKAHGNNNSCQLHLNHYDHQTADGSNLAQTARITDVDVTIYSVM